MGLATGHNHLINKSYSEASSHAWCDKQDKTGSSAALGVAWIRTKPPMGQCLRRRSVHGWMDGWMYWGQPSGSKESQGQQWGAGGAMEAVCPDEEMEVKGGHLAKQGAVALMSVTPERRGRAPAGAELRFELLGRRCSVEPPPYTQCACLQWLALDGGGEACVAANEIPKETQHCMSPGLLKHQGLHKANMHDL
ncbi:unnamed protein product [Pleuronectes platessa]|uniref:Uncharacterized protein n=1 Tax=Pleuronectes platessa TaxID=8262 RepID=A0A9N7ZEE4_PLEPL|nr:unnamed protein product [Pleuronectes platessa]